MRPQRSVERLLSGDPKQMAVAARDLGHELPRRRLDVLADFRSGIANGVHGTSNAYADGYADALLEVTAAFSAAVEWENRENEILDLIDADDAARDVVMARHDGRCMDSGIALGRSALDAVQRLQAIGVMEPFGTDPKYYRFTLLGERVAARLAGRHGG